MLPFTFHLQIRSPCMFLCSASSFTWCFGEYLSSSPFLHLFRFHFWCVIPSTPYDVPSWPPHFYLEHRLCISIRLDLYMSSRFDYFAQSIHQWSENLESCLLDTATGVFSITPLRFLHVAPDADLVILLFDRYLTMFCNCPFWWMSNDVLHNLLLQMLCVSCCVSCALLGNIVVEFLANAWTLIFCICILLCTFLEHTCIIDVSIIQTCALLKFVG